MAKKTNFFFNIDKLHLKLETPDGLIERFSQYGIGEEVQFDCFWLQFVDSDCSSQGEIIQITADLIVEIPTDKDSDERYSDNENEKMTLGRFLFKHTSKHYNEAFFEFENKALYTSFSCDKHSNGIMLLDYVLHYFGIEVDSIKNLEIALDINKNIYPKVLKMVRRTELYDVIFKGKVVGNRDKLYYHLSEVTRQKDLPKNPIFKTEHKDLQLKFYNKSKEISEVPYYDGKNKINAYKTYIEKYNDFGDDTIFRVEVTIKWERFLKWIKFSNSADSPLKEEDKQYISLTEGQPYAAPSESDKEYLRRVIFDLLLNELYRGQLWHYCVSRFIRFYDKKERKEVDVIDLLGGYKVLKKIP